MGFNINVYFENGFYIKWFLCHQDMFLRTVNISSNTNIQTYSTVIIYKLITLKWVPQVVTWRELKFKRLGLKMAPNKIPDIPSWAEGPLKYQRRTKSWRYHQLTCMDQYDRQLSLLCWTIQATNGVYFCARSAQIFAMESYEELDECG